jgi:3',5'-cyclic AMP phosphodiesterase CpdA
MQDNDTVIAHVSDLHFGDQSPIAVNALANSINHAAADALIVSGDLTQAGRKTEFIAARSFLAQFNCPVILVPGNHDLPVMNLFQRFLTPYKRYEQLAGGALDKVYRLSGASIIGLNSARRAALDVNWSFGRLSRAQIDWAARSIAAEPRDNFKLLAVHHPFVPGPGRAGSRIVGRGQEAISRMSDQGLDVALTGHVHVASSKLLELAKRRVILVQAGTATSMRTRGEPPSFNVLRLQSTNARRRVVVHRLMMHGDSFHISESSKYLQHAGETWREASE